MPRVAPDVGDPVKVEAPGDIPPDELAVTICAWNCTLSLEDAGNSTQIADSASSVLIQNLFLDPSIFQVVVTAKGADSSAFVHFHPRR